MSSHEQPHKSLIPNLTFLGVLVSVILAAVFCPGKIQAAPDSEAQGGLPMSMQLTSPAFSHNDSIPDVYTCDGSDTSPPLSWEGVPEGTKSLVLIVEDPDAPDPRAPRMIWVHWVLYNIPATATGLAENAGRGALPAGTFEGLNNWGRTGYGGPCPPIGRHRYFFKLYSLDTELPDLGEPQKETLLQAMQGHILASTELIGTYQH
jgi:Raf kinase inhibitor-like YbhB/YbcL family protein